MVGAEAQRRPGGGVPGTDIEIGGEGPVEARALPGVDRAARGRPVGLAGHP